MPDRKTDDLILNNDRGFTIIEFIVVAALVSAVMIMVIAQVKQGSGANQSATAIRNIATLSQEINVFKDPFTGFTGLSAAKLVDVGNIPPHMISATGVLTNVFGATIILSTNGSLSNEYIIRYAGVNNKNCVEIASKMILAFNYIGISSSSATPFPLHSLSNIGSSDPMAVFSDSAGASSCRFGANQIWLYGS